MTIQDRAALAQTAAAHGPARILMNVAGVGSARRIVQKDGRAAPAFRSPCAVHHVSFTISPTHQETKP